MSIWRAIALVVVVIAFGMILGPVGALGCMLIMLLYAMVALLAARVQPVRAAEPPVIATAVDEPDDGNPYRAPRQSAKSAQ